MYCHATPSLPQPLIIERSITNDNLCSRHCSLYHKAEWNILPWNSILRSIFLESFRVSTVRVSTQGTVNLQCMLSTTKDRRWHDSLVALEGEMTQVLVTSAQLHLSHIVALWPQRVQKPCFINMDWFKCHNKVTLILGRFNHNEVPLKQQNLPLVQSI